MKSGKLIAYFSILVILLIFFFLLSLITGPVKIPPTEIIGLLFHKGYAENIANTVIFDFRLPKAVTAVLAGSALSVSGLQMQTVFRNPLAGPYVLGISSGASLGIALIIMGFGSFLPFHQINVLGSWIQIMAAWAGSALVLFLILFVSLRVKDIMTILILGILFGSAASAIVSILQYFSQQTMLKSFVIWSMGSLGSLSREQLWVLIPCIVTGLLLAFLTSKSLNALLIGENYARSLGVNIRFSRISVFFSTSILAGSITAFCGPIGFIGIAVPHLVRNIFRTSDHRILIPGCLIFGAVVLLISDLLSQLPSGDIILPINSVTALLGIPIVIWLVIKNRKLTVIH